MKLDKEVKVCIVEFEFNGIGKSYIIKSGKVEI